eukprot:scaffold13485_cov110-Isochrysis_galbana.AAC.4
MEYSTHRFSTMPLPACTQKARRAHRSSPSPSPSVRDHVQSNFHPLADLLPSSTSLANVDEEMGSESREGEGEGERFDTRARMTYTCDVCLFHTARLL